MRMLSFAILAVLTLAGCSRPAADSAPERGTQGAEAPPSGPNEAWLREVIRAGRLHERLAPEGVVWIEHYRRVEDEGRDPRAGAEGLVRRAQRRCSDDLSEATRQLEQQLRQKLAALGDAAIRCEANRCILGPAMEFDLEVVMEFTQGPAEPLLSSVMRRDPPAHSNDAAQTDAWIARARRAASGPCPATAPTPDAE